MAVGLDSPVPPGTNLYKRLINADNYWMPYFYTSAWVRHYSMHSEMFIDWITKSQITTKNVINSLLKGLLQRNFNPFVVHLKRIPADGAAKPRYGFTSVLLDPSVNCAKINDFITQINGTPPKEKARRINEVLNTTGGRAEALNDEILAFSNEEFDSIFEFITGDDSIRTKQAYGNRQITKRQLVELTTHKWANQGPPRGPPQGFGHQQGPPQGFGHQQGPPQGHQQGPRRNGSSRWNGGGGSLKMNIKPTNKKTKKQQKTRKYTHKKTK